MTTQPKHTPAPWEVDSVFDKNGKRHTRIAAKDGLTITVFAGNVADPFSQDKANARLIAAAPELLQWLVAAEDMLKQCMQQTVFTIGACANMKEIRAAIAKATGGQ